MQIHANSAAKLFKQGPRCRDQHSYAGRKSYSCTTRLICCYQHRNMSTLDLAWETVEMNPEAKEAAQDSTSRAKT